MQTPLWTAALQSHFDHMFGRHKSLTCCIVLGCSCDSPPDFIAQKMTCTCAHAGPYGKTQCGNNSCCKDGKETCMNGMCVAASPPPPVYAAGRRSLMSEREE